MSEKDGSLEAGSEVQAVKTPEDEFPEGGLAGWSTLCGATLVQYATFGYINAFGVYQGNEPLHHLFLPLTNPEDFYVREYLVHYTPSEIGWIGGTQIFLTFAAGLFTGRLFDSGYFHHMMIGGAILHSFCYFMLSLSHENQYYQIFLSQALGGGIAAGIVYIPSLAVVSHYFKRNRPLAMGIVASGTALGATLHPIMLNKLFHGPIGFQNGVRISAALNSSLLIIANCMMRTRLPPKKTGAAIPLAKFARDPPYLIATIAGMLIVCGLFFPIFFLQLDAITHGVDRNFSFYCIPIMNAASVIGRTIPTILAPRVGVFNMITFFMFGMAAVTYSLGAVKDEQGIIAFAVFFGFFSGGGITLLPPMLSLLATDMGEIGARIGIFFAFNGIIGLFATPIAGALLTTHFYWWRAIVFAGTAMLVGASLLLVARFLVARRKGTVFV